MRYEPVPWAHKRQLLGLSGMGRKAAIKEGYFQVIKKTKQKKQIFPHTCIHTDKHTDCNQQPSLPPLR